MNYKNGFFQLVHKEDGTYVKILPAKNGGKQLKVEDVAAYLHFKKIVEFNIRALNEAILRAHEPTEFHVTKDTVPPENEYLKITVSMDKTKVIGRFYPPSSKGKLISKEEILAELAHKGIRHGIIEKNIDAYLRKRQFCSNFPLAEATPPRHGKDAVITYHFNTNITSKPTIKEDGTVDFHQLDNISGVEQGQLLATLEPADLGDPGMDVYGTPIKPKKVVSKHLKHGNNIYLSEDGTKMYANVSGHVSLVEDKVFVSNTYEVPTDVGPATGDIKYDGNVTVKGNVIAGYKIETSGDIVVYGVVEGAVLNAGGNIVLKRGIQGMNRGVLNAEGDIVTKFVENSEVYAGGRINTDAIMHSQVTSKGDIVVTGKRGLVAGGSVKSETMITLKTAGSTMGTKTNLMVGIDPKLAEEFKILEKKVIDIAIEIEKLESVIEIYKKKLLSGGKLKGEQIKHFKISTKRCLELHAERKVIEERIEEIREEVEKHESGKIRVENIIYPGCKLEISNAVYYVRGEMQYCQFIKDQADIKAVTL